MGRRKKRAERTVGRRALAASAPLLAAATALAVLTGPAAADFIILASTSGTYERGDLLLNEHELALEEGARLRIMSPAGDTRELLGPQNGLVSGLEGALDPAEDGFRRLVAYLGAEGRGETETAAARAADAAFFVSGTPVGVAGATYCYESADQLTIERRNAVGEATATVSGRAGDGTATFADGVRIADWPAPVRSGQEYAVTMRPGLSARVTLSRVVGLSSASQELRLLGLAEKGCFVQIDQILAREG